MLPSSSMLRRTALAFVLSLCTAGSSAAQTESEAYDEARAEALAAVEAGQFSRAQFWLRRAMTLAPDAEELARTASDFRLVRDRNPLRLSFGLAIAPSANATNGTHAEVIEIDGEPLLVDFGIGEVPLSVAHIDRAYAGWSYAPSVDLSWRLAADAASESRIWAQAQWRGVILSDSARAELDGKEFDDEQIRARHFSTGQALAGFEHRRLAPGGSYTLTAHLGRNWQRGEVREDLVNLGVARVFALPEGALTFGGNLEWRFDAERDDRDQRRVSLRLGRAAEIGDGWQMRGDVVVTRALSDYHAHRFDRIAASLNASPRVFLPGIGAAARLGAIWTHYPDYAFFDPVPGGRSDLHLSAGIDLTVARISYAGFSPLVSIEAHHTRSNINQFESEGLAFSLGFVSTF